MNVIVEKRLIVGTLKTLVGTYQLLDDVSRIPKDLYRFHVVDDEAFENWITLSGDFVIIPSALPVVADVRRIMTEEEEQEYKLSKKLDELEPSQTTVE